MQLMHEAPGLPPDRAALAEALEYDLDRLVSQATAPNIGDHFDFGIWSLDTCIVSQEVRPAPGAVLYALDMRPILCGLTWGLAEQGWVLADPIVNRFRSLCSMGFQPVLSGGRPGFAAGLPCRFVGPGTVLAVTFVPVEPPGTISQAEQAALIPTDEASTPAASTGAEGARAADPLASISDASFASGDAGASSGQQLTAYAAHAAVPLEAFRLTDLTRTWGFLWAPAPGALLSSGLGSLLDMFLFTVGFLLLYASRAIRSVRTMRCFWLLLAVGWGVQSCRAMQTLPPASVHPGAPAPKPSCTAVAREGTADVQLAPNTGAELRVAGPARQVPTPARPHRPLPQVCLLPALMWTQILRLRTPLRAWWSLITLGSSLPSPSAEPERASSALSCVSRRGTPSVTPLLLRLPPLGS